MCSLIARVVREPVAGTTTTIQEVSTFLQGMGTRTRQASQDFFVKCIQIKIACVQLKIKRNENNLWAGQGGHAGNRERGIRMRGKDPEDVWSLHWLLVCVFSW